MPIFLFRQDRVSYFSERPPVVAGAIVRRVRDVVKPSSQTIFSAGNASAAPNYAHIVGNLMALACGKIRVYSATDSPKDVIDARAF